MAAICGIDWADEWHDVRISDADGTPLAQRRFSHEEAGIAGLLAVLDELGVELAAIERPDGLLVGRLLAAGITVLAIHPNQVAAARDRFRAAAGKTDAFDSYVLCELARTDRHRFPALAPSSDETSALRALVRTREDLVAARVALANQLRAQLDAFWPGARRIFADIDSPIGLAFLERYPSPADARGLGAKRLHAFLARHAYCGRRHPEALLERSHICVLADSTRHWHPWARDVYTRARARGCDHPHAIRILGRAWTRILWRCWQDGLTYDPTHHRAATRHLGTAG